MNVYNRELFHIYILIAEHASIFYNITIITPWPVEFYSTPTIG